MILLRPLTHLHIDKVYSVTSSIPQQWAIPYTTKLRISDHPSKRKRIDAVHDGGVDSPRPAPSARPLSSSDGLVSDNIGLLASLALA